MQRGLIWVALMSLSCANPNADLGAPPEKSTFYYPIALTTVPALEGLTERYALVVSSNFDLRFSSGWVSLVKVDDDDFQSAQTPADVITSQVRVPSFGGPVAFAPSDDGSRALAFVAHRGTQRLSIIEVTVQDGAPQLSCADSSDKTGLSSFERHTDCDRRHLFALDDKANLSGFDVVPDPADLVDPYPVAVFRDDRGQHLAVGFLDHGSSLTTELLVFGINMSAGPGEPFLSAENAITLGLAGIGALAVRPSPPSAAAEPLCASLLESFCPPYLAATTRLASSGSEQSTVYGISIIQRTLTPGTLTWTPYVEAHPLSNSAGGTQESAIVFAPDGQRAYVSDNSPDALVSLSSELVPVLDTTFPKNYRPAPAYTVVDVLSTPPGPSGLAYLPRTAQDLVAVASLQDDEVDLVAAAGAALVPVVQLRDVGLGPYAITRSQAPSGDDELLVTTFFDHGLTLIRVPASDVQGASVVAHVHDTSLGTAPRQ